MSNNFITPPNDPINHPTTPDTNFDNTILFNTDNHTNPPEETQHLDQQRERNDFRALVHQFATDYSSIFEREHEQQLQEQRTFRALVNRLNSHQETLDYILINDDSERSSHETHYRSRFDRHNTILSWTADTNISRFWFDSTAHDVDGTTKTPYYVELPTTTYNPDSDFYYTRPSAYRIVTTNLSPHAISREYGRVFFHTVTRYIPHDTPTYPRRKTTPVHGYILNGTSKQYCLTYTNPYKNILYTTSSTGILKTPTLRGHIVTTLINNLIILRTYSTQDWNPSLNSIALRYFYELREHYNFQIEDWAQHIIPLEPPGLPYQERVLLHRLNYNTTQAELNTHITLTIQNRLEYKYACVRIQRFWRAKTHYYPKLLLNKNTNTAWRRYTFRHLGTRFTILNNNIITTNSTNKSPNFIPETNIEL